MALTSIRRLEAHEQGVILGLVETDFGPDKTLMTYSLNRYAPDGTLQRVLFQDKQAQGSSRATVTIGAKENDFTRYWALCPDGQTIHFHHDHAYKMEVFDSQGKPEMTISRDFPPVRRSDREIERDRKRQEFLRQQIGDLAKTPIAKFSRPVSGVFPRPNGDLWVKNGQGDADCPEQALGYFDVFNPAGRYVNRVCIRADFNPERDTFRLLGNRLIVLKETKRAPGRTSSSAGGGMLTVIIGASDDPEEGEDPRPYEVICYLLP